MTPIHKSFIAVLLLIFVGCDKNRVFDDYQSVGENWKKNDTVKFSFKQLDTQKKYNLFVNIRNNSNYQFNNLFLIVALQEPGGKIKRDTLQYEMAAPDGTLLGEGFSDIKESKLYYKEKFRFSKAGEYKIAIQHAVRQAGKIEGVQELKGVSDVGFRIESL
jgi:gliding motility-associated lipoprotein GldH